MNIQYSTYSTHKDGVQYTHVQYTRILYSTHSVYSTRKDAFENILL